MFNFLKKTLNVESKFLIPIEFSTEMVSLFFVNKEEHQIKIPNKQLLLTSKLSIYTPIKLNCSVKLYLLYMPHAAPQYKCATQVKLPTSSNAGLQKAAFNEQSCIHTIRNNNTCFRTVNSVVHAHLKMFHWHYSSYLPPACGYC